MFRLLVLPIFAVLALLSASAVGKVLANQHSSRHLQEGSETALYSSSGAWFRCTGDNDCINYLGWGRCNYATGYCVPGQFGQSCSVNSNCQSNACSIFFQICVTPCTTSCQNIATNFCWNGYCYPQQPLGGKCRDTSDCLSGICINGICTSSAQHSCGYPGSPTCPFGTYCSGRGLCVNRLSNGQSCNANFMCLTNNCQNAICATAGQQQCGCIGCPVCPFGTYCTGLVGGIGYCAAILPNGSPCSFDFMCKSGTCNNGFCVPSGQQHCGCSGCSACPSGTYCTGLLGGTGYCAAILPDGSPCNFNFMCQSGICNNGICSGPNSVRQCNCPGCPPCPWTMYCSSNVNGMCLALKPNGSPCSSSNQCLLGYCSPYTYLCANRGSSGDLGCPGPANSCPGGHFCQYSTTTGYACVAKRSASSHCTVDWECLSNKCSNNQCT